MSNRGVAVALLLMLLMFAGPNFLPRIVNSFIPVTYEGVPCDWLRTADDRANHQSLVGRSAANPISLIVQTNGQPSPSDPADSLVVEVIVSNDSLGTVPFVYNPAQVTVGDNGSSGLGILFEPVNPQFFGATRPNAASYPDSEIRILGPRQRCVHTFTFAANTGFPTLINVEARIKAFYRNNSPGQTIPVQQPGGIVATPIYTDQGLWTGYTESPIAVIPLPPF